MSTTALSEDDVALLEALVSAPTRVVVAQLLGVTPRQVRRRVRAVIKKMGVEHERAAIAVAVNRGVLFKGKGRFPDNNVCLPIE